MTGHGPHPGGLVPPPSGIFDRGGHLPRAVAVVRLMIGEEILSADGRRVCVVGDQPHHRRARLRTTDEAAALAARETGGTR